MENKTLAELKEWRDRVANLTISTFGPVAAFVARQNEIRAKIAELDAEIARRLV